MRTLHITAEPSNVLEGFYEVTSDDIFPELGDIVIVRYPNKEVRTVATSDECRSCIFHDGEGCKLIGNPIHCSSAYFGLTLIDKIMEDI